MWLQCQMFSISLADHHCLALSNARAMATEALELCLEVLQEEGGNARLDADPQKT